MIRHYRKIAFCKELRKVTAHLPGGKKPTGASLFYITSHMTHTNIFTLLGCSESLSYREEKGSCC